jgi:transposase
MSRANDRVLLNGMLCVLTTGFRWCDMPVKYGSYKTCWDRFRRWSVMGVWSKVLEALIAIGYSNGKLRLDKVAVDSTTLRLVKSSMERFFAWLTNGLEG